MIQQCLTATHTQVLVHTETASEVKSTACPSYNDIEQNQLRKTQVKQRTQASRMYEKKIFCLLPQIKGRCSIRVKNEKVCRTTENKEQEGITVLTINKEDCKPRLGEEKMKVSLYN